MQLFRSNLAEAIGWADPTQRHLVKPPIKDGDWFPPLRQAIFTAFAMGKVGDRVELLKRAANQVIQGGVILFDEPENDHQMSFERPYLECLEWYRKEQDRKMKVRDKHWESVRPLVMTEEMTSAIQQADYSFPRLKKGGRIVSMIKYVRPEIEHRAADWGVIWSNRADTCHIINAMIRHGVLTIVKMPEEFQDVRSAVIRTGPQYERALAMFKIIPDHRPVGVQAGVDYSYYNRVGFGEIPPKFPHGT